MSVGGKGGGGGVRIPISWHPNPYWRAEVRSGLVRSSDIAAYISGVALNAGRVKKKEEV